MKNILQKFLAIVSRKIISKYKPIVIGITGSVGKTSTKEAVFFVVNEKYKAYRPQKNLNNEFGLPLGIIGVDSGGRNIFAWISIFFKALGLIFFQKKYPEVLILEYGVDKPGDMDYLLSIARPNLAVITTIGLSHYQFFKGQAAIAEEKGKLAAALSDSGTLLLNADNALALSQAKKTSAKVLSYGAAETADVQLQNIVETIRPNLKTTFSVLYKENKFEATINALGITHLSATAAAIACGIALGIDSELIRKGVAQYSPAPGRLNFIKGIKNAIIIDDSYNAADPEGVREALAVLTRTQAEYKMAVLGTMRELGTKELEEHQQIGVLVATLPINLLITVGDGGDIIAAAAEEAGFGKEKIFRFSNADDAKKAVKDLLKERSLILIKGSQFVRLEKITKEIMAEPEKASKLLVRQ